MKLLEQKIKALLLENLYQPEEFIYKKREFDYVLKRYKEDIENILEDLDGTFPEELELEPLPIVNDKFLLKIWSTLDFNRYRIKTLRADFYDGKTGFKLDQYRLNCRNQENECLKKGTSPNYWTNTGDEKFFGQSEEAGDLGLNGSASWKMRAFKNFIQDLLLFHQNNPVIIISIYDKLMVNGSLITIEKLLLEHPTDFDKYFWQFFSRKIREELFSAK